MPLVAVAHARRVMPGVQAPGVVHGASHRFPKQVQRGLHPLLDLVPLLVEPLPMHDEIRRQFRNRNRLHGRLLDMVVARVARGHHPFRGLEKVLHRGAHRIPHHRQRHRHERLGVGVGMPAILEGHLHLHLPFEQFVFADVQQRQQPFVGVVLGKVPELGVLLRHPLPRHLRVQLLHEIVEPRVVDELRASHQQLQRAVHVARVAQIDKAFGQRRSKRLQRALDLLLRGSHVDGFFDLDALLVGRRSLHMVFKRL